MRHLRGPTTRRGRAEGDGHSGCQADVERIDVGRVRVVVIKIRLLGRHQITKVGLEGRGICLSLGVLELGNGDRLRELQ